MKRAPTKTLPSQIELRDLFYYRDGDLYWREGTVGHRKDAKAGCGDQYRSVGIGKNRFLLHRLIWTYHYGEIPMDFVVDHINRDKTDNRIENLRIANIGVNTINTNNGEKGLLGIPNAYWCDRKHKFYYRDRKNKNKRHYYTTWYELIHALYEFEILTWSQSKPSTSKELLNLYVA